VSALAVFDDGSAVGPALFLGDADENGARGIVKDKGHEREAFAQFGG